MIEYLKPNLKGIIELKKPTKDCWINVYNPDEEELNYLVKLLKVKENEISDFKNDINSLQDLEEIPILEKWGTKYFMITRTAQKGKGIQDKSLEYHTTPIGILITNDYVITIGFIKSGIIKQFKERNIKFNRISFVLKLLLQSSRNYLTYLKEMDRKILTIEHRLEESPRNTEIMKLLNLEKSLVFFNTSLKGNQILYERIAKLKSFSKSEAYEDLIEDMLDENKQGIEMAQVYSNIIKSTLDVYSSIISNNLNKVMKVLTSITIIIAIPTLIASIYGMNVILPFQQSLYAFEITMFISLVFTILLVIILWKKKWI